jgi:hypothetical protein
MSANLLYLRTIMAKKYDPFLIERVTKLREGLGSQPFAKLSTIQPSLREHTVKHRRILCYRVFPGDVKYVEQLEKAKLKLSKAMHDD